MTPLGAADRYHSTVVDHRPACCPECGSSRSRIVKTDHPALSITERSHHCNNCKTKFKSHQIHTRTDKQFREAAESIDD